MSLRETLRFTSIAFGAAVSASLITTHLDRRTLPDKVALRELVIVDEKKQPTAGIASYNGRTVLTFYSPNSPRPALEVGLEDGGATRFLRFFGGQGQVIAAIDGPSNGGSTLYLGDELRETRVTMGALQTDIPAQGVVRDWGLVFRAPGYREALFNLIVKAPAAPQQPTAAIRLVRSNGGIWTVQ